MDDKRCVYKECKHLGVKYGGNTNNKGGKKNNPNSSASDKNTIKQLCHQCSSLMTRIKAIKNLMFKMMMTRRLRTLEMNLEERIQKRRGRKLDS